MILYVFTQIRMQGVWLFYCAQHSVYSIKHIKGGVSNPSMLGVLLPKVPFIHTYVKTICNWRIDFKQISKTALQKYWIFLNHSTFSIFRSGKPFFVVKVIQKSQSIPFSAAAETHFDTRRRLYSRFNDTRYWWP